MLLAHWECKHSRLNDTGKDYKPTTDFEKILTLSLVRGFDLVLPLAVTSPLITPVMGISWTFILLKEWFDMLSSIGYGDFVRVFWSSRRYDKVYLGWFIFDLVWRLFTMQASRRSVKAHYSFGSIVSFLSACFQVYLSKCWGPYISPSCTMCFFLQFSCPISACWSCHYLSKRWVSSLPVLALGSVHIEKGNRTQFFRRRTSFLGSLLFFLLSVLVNGINKSGWCHERSRGCWLKGCHQIPKVRWIFHQSLHLHIY